MTITATNASNTLLGNGNATAFPFTFAAQSAAEVAVYVNGTLQATGYSVAINGNGNGGTVTFALAPINAAIVEIVSKPSFAQNIAFTNGGPFLAATHDLALDRATIRDIYLNARIDRAGVPFGVDIANKLLGFDANGVLTATDPVVGGGSVGATVEVKDEGLTLGLAASFNFVGAGVTMTGAGGEATVTIPGGGGTGASIGIRADDYLTTNTPAGNTAGLAALSNYVMTLNTGVVIDFTPGKEYVVGTQTFGPVQTSGRFTNYTGVPGLMFELRNHPHPVEINLNNCRFKIAPGLKYGSYNADGTPFLTTPPYYGATIATHYDAIFLFDGCSGHIAIKNGELNGNVERVQLGGEWGDTGWQLGGYGLKFINHTGSLDISGINSHDHTGDSAEFDGDVLVESGKSILGNVRNSKFNRSGRLGASIVGARGISFSECEFNDNGRSISTTTANFTASFSGTVMTVTAVASGTIKLRDVVFGQGARFTANITNNQTLNVTAVEHGVLEVGQVITGANVKPGSKISALGTGTGGVGTYTLDLASTATVSSREMSSEGPDIPLNIQVVSFGTGTGGTGTYNLSEAVGTITSRSVRAAGYLSSAPASGTDFEAEGGKINRDILYTRCDFMGNKNTQIVTDSGTPTKRITFHECRFVAYIIGSAAVWPNRPEVRFKNCLIAGTCLTPWQDATDPFSRPSFEDCILSSDHSYSPTGFVNTSNKLLIDGNYAQVPFTRCKFDFARGFGSGNGGGIGGSSGEGGPDYTDCTFVARPEPGAAQATQPTVAGSFWGKTEFLELGGSSIQSTPGGGKNDAANAAAYPFRFKLNAGPAYGPWSYTTGNPTSVRTVYPATHDMHRKEVIFGLPFVYDPPSLATGAQQSQVVVVPGAVIGSIVEVTFSLALAGTSMRGEVTAANTVTVYHRNDTGAAVDLASGTLNIKVTAP